MVSPQEEASSSLNVHRCLWSELTLAIVAPACSLSSSVYRLLCLPLLLKHILEVQLVTFNVHLLSRCLVRLWFSSFFILTISFSDRGCSTLCSPVVDICCGVSCPSGTTGRNCEYGTYKAQHLTYNTWMWHIKNTFNGDFKIDCHWSFWCVYCLLIQNNGIICITHLFHFAL